MRRDSEKKWEDWLSLENRRKNQRPAPYERCRARPGADEVAEACRTTRGRVRLWRLAERVTSELTLERRNRRTGWAQCPRGTTTSNRAPANSHRTSRAAARHRPVAEPDRRCRSGR